MRPTDRFVDLVRGPEADLALDEAALLIAAHDHPVDVVKERRRLDDLASGLPSGDLDALRRRLYVDHGLAGNEAEYYDPANSFLDQVMERRQGIPITLAVVLLEVGRRCHVEL